MQPAQVIVVQSPDAHEHVLEGLVALGSSDLRIVEVTVGEVDVRD